ncbi:MAG: hypothetical protein QG626_846 [Patescibacteria group bacterium]|nr:hypothetical protein [Patescibacteria group bacterium]
MSEYTNIDDLEQRIRHSQTLFLLVRARSGSGEGLFRLGTAKRVDQGFQTHDEVLLEFPINTMPSLNEGDLKRLSVTFGRRSGESRINLIGNFQFADSSYQIINREVPLSHFVAELHNCGASWTELCQVLIRLAVTA